MRKARKTSAPDIAADAVPPQRASAARRASLRSSPARLALYHALLLGGLFLFWYLMTEPGLIPPFYFDEPTRAKFFFGQPQEVFKRVWNWFAGGSTMNAMPRVILAPIFAVWFGLGITSKVVFGVTLVFFIVFFNVYQGVKEVSPVVLANARMLGASGKQLLRYVYLPSATSWVFSSLHTSVGLAFVGAVVGEYLGSARGVGYLIHQAEGVFDIDTVFAGILVLTIFALILDFIVTKIESRLLVWRPGTAETEAL